MLLSQKSIWSRLTRRILHAKPVRVPSGHPAPPGPSKTAMESPSHPVTSVADYLGISIPGFRYKDGPFPAISINWW
jgi:hypothetical protein